MITAKYIRNLCLTAALCLSAGATSAEPWQTARLLNEPEETAVKTARIYAASTGGFHVVYGNTKPAWQVVYRRYRDGYLTQKKAIRNVFCPNPDICEAGNGDIHLVWEDWTSANYAGWAKSSDGGQTFNFAIITPWDGCKYPLVAPFGPSAGPDVVFSCAYSKTGEPKKLYWDRYNGSAWGGIQDMNSYFESEYQIEGICRSLHDGTVFRSYGRIIGGVYHVCYRRYNGSYWEPEVALAQPGFFSRQSIAVNSSGHVMVMWEGDYQVFTAIRYPDGSWGPTVGQEYLSTHAALTAIPGTDDFYLVYTHDKKRIYGRRYSGGGWLPKELVSVGLPDAFTVGADVCATEDGTIYACWEYWGSGDCQQWFSVKPGATGPRGTVSGYVRDTQGQGISGATVGSGGFATVSGPGGAYSLQITVGTHSISASKDYYIGQTIPGVQVFENQTTLLDFVITPNPPGPVSSFRATPSDGIVRLAWTNPSSGNFHATKIIYRTDQLPTGPADPYAMLLCDRQTPPGSSDSVDHVGVANGVTYYYAAYAHDADGHYAAPAYVAATPHLISCLEAKQTPDGPTVDLRAKVITAVFTGDGSLFVEEPDRTSGIRVLYTGTGLAVGDYVDVTGTVSTRYVSSYPSERQIVATSVVRSTPLKNEPLRPVAMNSLAVGGAPTGLVPGVKDGVGLNNMGTLVSLAGRVTLVVSSLIYVDDGSGIADISGRVGVAVKCPGVPDVMEGDMVSVTGVIEGSIPSGWTTNRRYLHTRDWNDVRVLSTAPPPGSIAGVVRDTGGAGLANASVSTSPGGYSTTTGTNGSYVLSNVPAGTYDVTASKVGYASQTINSVAVSAGQTTSGIDFTLSVNTGTISGTVKDTAGNGIVGASVSTSPGGYSTTTGTNGSYVLSNIPPGTYNVTASKTGYVSQTINSVAVSAGQTTSGIDFTLSVNTGTISGTVKDTAGNGIVGASVSTSPGGYSTTTGTNGSYVLSNVLAGIYSVTASKTGYNPVTYNNVTVNASQVTTVNFTLTAAPTEKVVNGNMEGGFYNTGWGTDCSGRSSQLPNPSGSSGWGWNNQPGVPFNTWDSTGIKHGGSHALGFSFCQTASSPGKIGIACQSVNLGAPGATGTFSAWGYHTDGNCPTIMCWNPGAGQADPMVAYSNGRYQWITTDNWGQLNTWVSRSMNVTADSSGYVTIMVGGAAYPGTASAAPLYIDDVSVL